MIKLICLILLSLTAFSHAQTSDLEEVKKKIDLLADEKMRLEERIKEIDKISDSLKTIKINLEYAQLSPKGIFSKTKRNTSMRSNLDIFSDVIEIIPKGTKVLVVSFNGRSYEISYNGKSGYVSFAEIEQNDDIKKMIAHRNAADKKERKKERNQKHNQELN